MVEAVSKPPPAHRDIFKAIQLLSAVSSAHYGDPLYDEFSKHLAAFSSAQHKEAHETLKSTKITDFFNSAGTDNSTTTFRQSRASQTLLVITSDNSVGRDVETDIMMENDRPDAGKSESEGESESISVSDASVELLTVISAPLVAKRLRTGCYLENEDRRSVFVPSTQDLYLFCSSMQAPMIQALTNAKIMGQQSDPCITAIALSIWGGASNLLLQEKAPFIIFSHFFLLF